MGRGRAKAKQTKVARELKYNTGSLDPDRLKAELTGGGRVEGEDLVQAQLAGQRVIGGLEAVARPDLNLVGLAHEMFDD